MFDGREQELEARVVISPWKHISKAPTNSLISKLKPSHHLDFDRYSDSTIFLHTEKDLS